MNMVLTDNNVHHQRLKRFDTEVHQALAGIKWVLTVVHRAFIAHEMPWFRYFGLIYKDITQEKSNWIAYTKVETQPHVLKRCVFLLCNHIDLN